MVPVARTMDQSNPGDVSMVAVAINAGINCIDEIEIEQKSLY